MEAPALHGDYWAIITFVNKEFELMLVSVKGKSIAGHVN